MLNFNLNDTIVALATAPGPGAIAVFRISGADSFEIGSRFLRTIQGGAVNIHHRKSHTAFLAAVMDDELLDEALVTVFHGPNSYTGENTLEIGCHGSAYIQQRMLDVCIKSGARLAEPGEFTLRAFMNGRMDLSQAEAVADLIASDSSASHQVALRQLRGGFSHEIKAMRESLIQFAALIELELDFSEEDVEFANREQLQSEVTALQNRLTRLIESFEWGNVLKNGVPVVIAGKPNAGKSTLLNALLNEERAIVSEIAGTTRDTIEEEITLNGIKFRFTDTAGLRETKDAIEQIGVQRTWEKMRQSPIILYLFDVNETTASGLRAELEELTRQLPTGYHLIPVGNKTDGQSLEALDHEYRETPSWIGISARHKTGIAPLLDRLTGLVTKGDVASGETIVTNARHVSELKRTAEALTQVQAGLADGRTHDFVAGDLRYALHHLGLITGTISNNDLLETIFSKFCIGK